MRRREFITLVGSTAACWPLAAFAQQSERMRRIGVLAGGGLDADDLDLQARIGAFEDGLKQLGWTNGQNVRIDIRWGAGDADRMRRNMYSTRQWKERRRLHRQKHPLCKRCLEKGRIVAAQVVH